MRSRSIRSVTRQRVELGAAGAFLGCSYTSVGCASDLGLSGRGPLIIPLVKAERGPFTVAGVARSVSRLATCGTGRGLVGKPPTAGGLRLVGRRMGLEATVRSAVCSTSDDRAVPFVGSELSTDGRESWR
jgi:hypothetical protein